MRIKLVVIGAILGLLFLAGIGAFFFAEQSDRGETELAEAAGQANEALQAKADEMARLEQSLDEAKKEAAALEAALSETRAALAEAESKPDTPETLPPSAEPEEALTGEESADEPGAKPTREGIAESIRSNGAVTTQLRALNEMIYGSLLREMEFPKEEGEHAIALLAENSIEQVTLTQYAMSLEDATWSEWREWRDEEDARLSAQFKEILSAGDYAIWETFWQDKEEWRFRGQFAPQIRTYAAGLTAENQELVLDVSGGAFADTLQEYVESDAAFTRDTNIEMQLAAFQRIREQLQETLEEDQLREVNRWLELNESALEAARPKRSPASES